MADGSNATFWACPRCGVDNGMGVAVCACEFPRDVALRYYPDAQAAIPREKGPTDAETTPTEPEARRPEGQTDGDAREAGDAGGGEGPQEGGGGSEERPPAEEPEAHVPGQLRVLSNEYVYDHRIAECDGCPLQASRDETICLSQQPKNFNGLMIVGEGPGADEAREKVPFIGKSGQLLNGLLETAGIERANTYVSNATLCLPRGLWGKEKDKALAVAIKHCRRRLLTEIQHLQPKVIVALGGHALNTLAGEIIEQNKREPYDCPTCKNVRKWKCYGCSRCKVVFSTLPVVDGQEPPVESPCYLDDSPSECNIAERKGKPAKFQKRTLTCSDCGGTKTQVVTTTHFKSDYKISEVAGGIFTVSDLPGLSGYLRHPDRTYVIPTLHPAALLRPAETKSQKKIGGQFMAGAVLRHFQKARRILEDGSVDWDFEWEEINDPEIIRQRFAEFHEWSVDTETDAKKVRDVTRIQCIGFTPLQRPHYALVVDTDSLPADHPRVQAVIDCLIDWRQRKGFHNGFGYDIAVIKRIWGVDLEGYAFDGMVDHNCIAPDEPHSLAHTTFEFTDAPVWKPPKVKGGMLSFDTKEDLHRYNAKDCVALAKAHLQMRVEHEKELVQAVADIDMKKAVLAVEMQKRGMAVDREKMLIIGAKARAKMENALLKMREMTGRLPEEIKPQGKTEGDPYAFNPNSHQQLLWALYNRGRDGHAKSPGPCGFTPSAYTDETCKVPSTEKNALLPFADHPFVDQLLAFRNGKQDYNSIEGLPLGSDGRLHATWNPIGARTGRYSSSPNFQNWKKWLRAMVVALEGRKIVGADMAQLELRIIAGLCNDATMIDKVVNADESRKLEPEYDPHSYVSQMSFGTAYTDLLLKDPAHDSNSDQCQCQTCNRKMLRDVAKRVVYGLNYGAGAATIREAIYDGGYEGPAIDLDMVEQTVKAYFKAFPNVGPWRDEQLRIAQETGRVYDAVLGRFREFPLAMTPWADVESTIAYNFPIQSTAASIMDIAMWNFFVRLPSVDPTAFIFAQVHDAIYAECAEDKAPAVAKLLEECMNCEMKFTPDGEPIPLTATAEIADDWMHAA